MHWLGVDIGGTFTDLVLLDDRTGEVRTAKVPSTPANQAEGVLAGLAKIGASLETLRNLFHGTTVATNTLIERRGTSTAMVTNEGFRDLIEIGRTQRMDPNSMFDPTFQRGKPLIAREMRFEVRERTLADGRVETPPDKADLLALGKKIRAAKAGAVAVCLLHAYRNPAGERAAAAALRKAAPGIFVCLSSEVVPEYREYERFSTAVINAYLSPEFSKYLNFLATRLRERGFTREVMVMTSSGGMLPASTVSGRAFQALASGPAAGVYGAVFVARSARRPRLITCDMGGTSTDVCLVLDYTPRTVNLRHIESFPVKTPQLEICSVGAGGGSVAWVDDGRILRIGPQSAGARPGPACYGQGGTEATVTDSNLVLGRLPSHALGGEIVLRPELARAAVARLGVALGIRDAVRAAEGVIEVAVAKMVTPIRQISVEKGHDPRDFSLAVFGGAGPMHGIPIAEAMEIGEVLVPPHPGNLCALGLLAVDVRHDYVRTLLKRLDTLKWGEVKKAFSTLRAQAAADLRAEGFGPKAQKFVFTFDTRYVGQKFEIGVAAGGVNSLAALGRRFHKAYDARYGHASPGEPAEVVNLRLAAFGKIPRPRFAENGAAGRGGKAPRAAREVVMRGRALECPVYGRESLRRGERIQGPAVIEEEGSITQVFPGWRAEAAAGGTLFLRRIKR